MYPQRPTDRLREIVIAEEGISSIEKGKNILAPKGYTGLIYPYLDVVGVPTIGVGATMYSDGRKVTMNDAPLDMDATMNLFEDLLMDFSTSVYLLVTNTKATQSNVEGLISFAYNVGIEALKNSTLLKVVNNDPTDLVNIEYQWNRWVHAREPDGKLIVVPALAHRRVNEFNLYKGV